MIISASDLSHVALWSVWTVGASDPTPSVATEETADFLLGARWAPVAMIQAAEITFLFCHIPKLNRDIRVIRIPGGIAENKLY